MKRISSVNLSPIYTHFSESITGLVTIRALRHMDRFCTENCVRLEENQRAQYCSKVASQWLNIRLQMIGVAMVTGVAFIAVLEHHFQTVDPGMITNVPIHPVSHNFGLLFSGDLKLGSIRPSICPSRYVVNTINVHKRLCLYLAHCIIGLIFNVRMNLTGVSP